MEAKAYLKYARISPRKVGIVLDLIRNKPVDYAMAVLKYTPKAACEYLIKLLKSASANATNNFNMDASKLYISECFVRRSDMTSQLILFVFEQISYNFERILGSILFRKINK